MNLEIGRAFAPGGVDVGGGDELAILLHQPRDYQKRFQLGRDAGLGKVRLHLLDEGFIAAQMRGGDGAVDAVAIVGAIAARHIGRDQLAFAAAEGAGALQQYLNQCVEGTRGLRPEGHGATNAGKVGRKRDVGHGSFLLRD
jgi:hypothetical protein